MRKPVEEAQRAPAGGEAPLDAAATKPFGFMRFTPGPGVGGHCLPIDPSYLSWRVRRSLGESFRFVELANDIYEHMPAYVVRRLLVALNRRSLAVRGRRILLIGCGQRNQSGTDAGFAARAGEPSSCRARSTALQATLDV